jgi:3-isopropylmalate/(R)-2-methylmalate dehydratase large subunit
MRKTAYQKIVDAHLVKTLDDGRMVLMLDRAWCHEITTSNAILDAQRRGCDVVFNPNKIKAMIDNVNPSKDTDSSIQVQIVRNWCQKHSIEFLDVGRNGICHAIIPKKGWVRPGDIGIMGDSHTCTHGAFCSLSAGVGTTDLGHGIRTGLWICSPQKVIQVWIEGVRPNNVFAKDIILAIIGKIGVNGATNSILEFRGPIIDEMTMAERMTIANMAVEAGATSGMMMVDEITIEYLWPALKTEFSSKKKALDVFSVWNSDGDCAYNKIVNIDVTGMSPVITDNYSPGEVFPVTKLDGKKINQVYIGSCTNGRLEDLRIVAHVLRKTGAKIHKDVRCIVVPATHHIWRQANEEGLLDIFMDAECVVSYPTCGACLGMSNGVLAPGEVCVSTTNRNFPGRMGKDGMVHLASPLTAIVSAINGEITTPEMDAYNPGVIRKQSVASPSDWRDVDVMPVNYATLAKKQAGDNVNFSGKVLWFGEDNVDTDQIIPPQYLTETDMRIFGQHCLEGAGMPEDKRKLLFESQILIAGENFACGSSREHAVWALAGAGIRCVIAPSFARIFYDNMFSNGLLCIVLPAKDICEIRRFSELTINIKTGCIGSPSGMCIADFELSEYQKDLVHNGGSMGMMFKLATEVYGR